MSIIKRHFVCLQNVFLVFVLMMSPGLSYGADVPLTVEVYWDQRIPGMPQTAQFGFMDLPVVNNEGQIAFMARIKNSSDAPFRTSVWTKKEDGSLTLLVEDGMEALGISSSVFFADPPSFRINPLDPGRPSSLSINEKGEIAFGYYLEDLNRPGEMLSSAWVGTARDDLRLVVYEGMEQPIGGTFNGIAYERVGSGEIPVIFLNDNGQVVFASPAETSSSGTFWLEDPECDPGDTLAAITGWEENKIYNFTDTGWLGKSDFFTLVEDDKGILFARPGMLLPILSEGEQGPGMAGEETFDFLRGAVFDRSGSVAFNGYGTSHREYLYVYDLSGRKRLVAADDNAILGPQFLLQDGRVVYARGQFGAAGFDAGSYWLEDTLIVREGDVYSGSPSGERFRRIWLTGANKRGQLVFKAELEKDGEVTGSGVYAFDGSGDIVKVLQTSDEVEVAPGDTRVILDIDFNTSRENAKRVLNNEGKLVFRVSFESFTSISHGIVSAQLEKHEKGGCTDFPTAANFAYSETALGLINTYTGELVVSEPADIYLGGPLPLFFSRYYASGLNREGDNVLGRNWRHNFEMELTKVKNEVRVVTSTGGVLFFAGDGETDATWELVQPADIKYQLVTNNDELILKDPAKILYTFTISEAGDCRSRILSRIEDGKGNMLSLNYEGGNLQEVFDGLGRALTFQYDGEGHLASLSDGTREVTYGYSDGNLTIYRDLMGREVRYSYDTSRTFCGLMTDITLQNGKSSTTVSYDEQGKVVTLEDREQSIHSFTYDDGDTTVCNPVDSSGVGDCSGFEHGARGEILSVTDEVGNKVVYSYDDNGLLISVIDRLGGMTSYTYDDESGMIDSVTEADGSTTEYSYIKRNVKGIDFFDLTGVSHPDGTTESFTYDELGNLVTWKDQEINEWTYTYNNYGQVLTVNNPTGGGEVTYTYNDDGTLASFKDDKHTTSFGYDSLKRIKTILNPDNSTREYSYDGRDDLLEAKNELDNSNNFTYDDNGNFETLTDALQNTIKYDYDTMDRFSELTVPLGVTSKVTYDTLWRPKEITDLDGNTVKLGYNSPGWLTTVTDLRGKEWKTSYNAEGVIASTTDPMGKTTSLTSDAMGRITEVMSPLGNTVKANYDSMGRLRELENPLGKKATIDYDERGLVSQIQLPLGVKVSYERNELGQITKVTDPKGDEWLSEYDGHGRLIVTTDPLGSNEFYEYDNRNRLSHVTYPNNDTLDVTYDEAGNIIRLLYKGDEEPVVSTRLSEISTVDVLQAGDDVPEPDPIVSLEFKRDPLGYLTSGEGVSLKWMDKGVSLNLENKRIIESNGITITYNPGGQIATITYPPDSITQVTKTVTYTYEKNTLKEVIDWDGKKISFGYKDDGRLASVSRPNGFTTRYITYDDSKDPEYKKKNDAKQIPTLQNGMRIEEIAEDFPSDLEGGAILLSRYSLLLDKVGQIIEEQSSGVQATRSGRELKDVAIEYEKSRKIKGFKYDSGNRIQSDNDRFYAWDKAKRLFALINRNEESNKIMDTYRYDALGRRTERRVFQNQKENSKTKYIWNYALGTPRVTQIEHTAGGKRIVWSYVYTPSGHLLYGVRASDNKKVYYHFDHRGSTTFVSGGSGNIVEEYDYTVNGEHIQAGEGTDEEFEGFDFPNLFTFKGMFGWMSDAAPDTILPNIYCTGSAYVHSRYPYAYIDRMNWHRYDMAAPPEITYQRSKLMDAAIMGASGFLLLVLPEPTTSVMGTVQLLFALDLVTTGSWQAITNKHQDTMLHRTVRTGVTHLTGSSKLGEAVATGGQMIIAPLGAFGMGWRLSSGAAYGTFFRSSPAPRSKAYFDELTGNSGIVGERGTPFSSIPKADGDFLFVKHLSLIRQLKTSDVAIIFDSNTSRLMGELMAATGKEIGLAFNKGNYYLSLGGPKSVNLSSYKWHIGHGHPSGRLVLSIGDVKTLKSRPHLEGHAIFDVKGKFRIFNAKDIKQGQGGRIYVPLKELANAKAMAKSELNLLKRKDKLGF